MLSYIMVHCTSAAETETYQLLKYACIDHANMKHQLFKYAWPKHEDNNKCVNRSSVYFVYY